IAKFIGSHKHKQRYAHVYGQSLQPVRDEVAFQYGGILYVTDTKGNLLHTGGEKHRGIIFNDLALDAASRQLLGGGQIGGDNTVYRFDLSNSDWWKTELQLSGRGAAVEKNLEMLYEQALNFKAPDYQSKSSKEWVMLTSISELPEVERLDFADIKFVKQVSMQENTPRDELVSVVGEMALKRDGRMRYD
ncbi:hypothetical protein P4B35_23975, partial [Pontiellaceae bacterium B12227]|nr:hypothetical protein [Pontiellaceae bacterium B12227]